MQSIAAHPVRSLLRIEQVMERVQRGRSWIWAAVQSGTFPAPRRLSPRCTRWDSDEIARYVEEQLGKGASQ